MKSINVTQETANHGIHLEELAVQERVQAAEEEEAKAERAEAEKRRAAAESSCWRSARTLLRSISNLRTSQAAAEGAAAKAAARREQVAIAKVCKKMRTTPASLRSQTPSPC